MNRLARLLLLCHAPAFSQNARVEYAQLNPELIRHRLELVSRKLPERKSTLESLFQEAGCVAEHFNEQPVHGPKEPNIICALEGEKPGTIVVGGHYDLVGRGSGAVDDWSGAVLLPSLYQSLKATPHRHRFEFVAFAREEVGLVGSHKFVDNLAREETEKFIARYAGRPGSSRASSRRRTNAPRTTRSKRS